jgi:hypothetical protein
MFETAGRERRAMDMDDRHSRKKIASHLLRDAMYKNREYRIRLQKVTELFV